VFSWTGVLASGDSSSPLSFRVYGDLTPASNHFPKTMTGTLSGDEFQTVTASVEYSRVAFEE